MAEIYRPVLVPVIEPMDPRRCNVYEHTPLDYYRYGEYPRFIRPIGANRPQTKIGLIGITCGSVHDEA